MTPQTFAFLLVTLSAAPDLAAATRVQHEDIHELIHEEMATLVKETFVEQVEASKPKEVEKPKETALEDLSKEDLIQMVKQLKEKHGPDGVVVPVPSSAENEGHGWVEALKNKRIVKKDDAYTEWYVKEVNKEGKVTICKKNQHIGHVKGVNKEGKVTICKEDLPADSFGKTDTDALDGKEKGKLLDAEPFKCPDACRECCVRLDIGSFKCILVLATRKERLDRNYQYQQSMMDKLKKEGYPSCGTPKLRNSNSKSPIANLQEFKTSCSYKDNQDKPLTYCTDIYDKL